MNTSSEKPVENAKEPAALRHCFQMSVGKTTGDWPAMNGD